MVDSDFSGENISLRSIFKFNIYRNFSLLDRLKYRTSFRFNEYRNQRRESDFLKTQINNDLLENDDGDGSPNFSLILKLSSKVYYNYRKRKEFIRSSFKEKDFLPLLSDINDEDEILLVIMILTLLLFIFFLDVSVF
jgi:hypothetical protein